MKRTKMAQLIIFVSSWVDWIMSIKTLDNTELHLIKKQELSTRKIPECPYRTKQHFV